ncbi:hypothetical protein [Olivibacter domesticus]|uniref:Uncharacterized protein n=1 Tax=Olivibacter domesticus TaxID=407022 RepID=A0A1H7ZC26_OLID1|nr:hypothetical protein [Olivibacter domesticus]SEM55771.1 hypothetical protein SAMN05661044_05482 [Olivibacter domesticus]
MKYTTLYGSILLLANACTSNYTGHIRDLSFQNDSLRVITMIVNERANTIAVLFGNKLALQNKLAQKPRENSELYKLVTWRQQPNTFWYGSNINGTLLCIETVEITSKERQVVPNYTLECFDSPFAEALPIDNVERTTFIMNQQLAVSP